MIGAWRSEPEVFGTDPRSYRSEYQERARERERRRAERRRRRRKAAVLFLSTTLFVGLIRWPGPTSLGIAIGALLAAAGFLTYQLVRAAIEWRR